jgi:hypothetical protein
MPQPIPSVKRLALVCSSNATPVNPTNFSISNVQPEFVASGLTVNVTATGSTYSLTISSGGINYSAENFIIIPGNLLGGVTPTNDLTAAVETVGLNGDVTAITSVAGTPVAAGSYSNVPVTMRGSGARFTVTNTNGLYGVTTTTNGTFYGNPATKLRVSGNLLGGSSPQNDLTFTYIGDDHSVTNISQNGAQDYSVVKFKLPTSYNEVIYMDWVTSLGLSESGFVQFGISNGVFSPGITTGGFAYWKFVMNNTVNNITDHMAVKQWSPGVDIPSELTVTLRNSQLEKLNQTSPWVLELVIYSLE